MSANNNGWADIKRRTDRIGDPKAIHPRHTDRGEIQYLFQRCCYKTLEESWRILYLNHRPQSENVLNSVPAISCRPPALPSSPLIIPLFQVKIALCGKSKTFLHLAPPAPAPARRKSRLVGAFAFRPVTVNPSSVDVITSLVSLARSLATWDAQWLRRDSLPPLHAT